MLKASSLRANAEEEAQKDQKNDKYQKKCSLSYGVNGH